MYTFSLSQAQCRTLSLDQSSLLSASIKTLGVSTRRDGKAKVKDACIRCSIGRERAVIYSESRM